MTKQGLLRIVIIFIILTVLVIVLQCVAPHRLSLNMKVYRTDEAEPIIVSMDLYTLLKVTEGRILLGNVCIGNERYMIDPEVIHNIPLYNYMGINGVFPKERTGSSLVMHSDFYVAYLYIKYSENAVYINVHDIESHEQIDYYVGNLKDIDIVR